MSSDVTNAPWVKAPGMLLAPARTFHPGDYAVFAITLLISAIIGLYIGIRHRKNLTVREMLLGGRNLGTLPVSLSLVATMTSTIFVLGVPSATYKGGDWPLYLAFSFIPATIITVHVFIPLLHKLGVTSAYEYLGLRFNKVIRFFAASLFIIMQNLTQALSIYTPAVGFSLVAGVSLEISIVTAGFVCTFYTALGGLRAVVVTDIFQIGTMLAGIIGLLIKGSIDAGGIDKIFQTATAHHRIQLWSEDWTQNTTYSFWSQFFGGTLIFLGLFASNQQTVQRYCSVKLCRDAQKAAYIAMVFYIIAWVLVLLVGLVIYTFYYTCDPLVMEVIYNPDQILPLFIMDTIGHLHGLPGLFSAAVFGAVLSSVSSGINSLAAVTLEDVVRPVHKRLKKKDISEETGKALTRSLALFYGVLTVALSYLPVRYGSYLSNMEVTFSAFGVLGGPIMGSFLLGTMVKFANSIGTGVGMIFGLLVGLWFWIGHVLCKNSQIKPYEVITPTDCHDFYNLTGFDPEERAFTGKWPGEGLFIDCPLQEMYDISFLWFGLITTTTTVFVGVIVSFCSGGHKGQVVNPDLLCWQRLKRRRREGRGLFGRGWPIFANRAKYINPQPTSPVIPNPLVMKTTLTHAVVPPVNENNVNVVYNPTLAPSYLDPSLREPPARFTDPEGVLYQPNDKLTPGLTPMPFVDPGGVMFPGDPYMAYPLNAMPPFAPEQAPAITVQPNVLQPGLINSGFLPDSGMNPVITQPIDINPVLQPGPFDPLTSLSQPINITPVPLQQMEMNQFSPISQQMYMNPTLPLTDSMNSILPQTVGDVYQPQIGPFVGPATQLTHRHQIDANSAIWS